LLVQRLDQKVAQFGAGKEGKDDSTVSEWAKKKPGIHPGFWWEAVAEGVGFEPTVGASPDSGLANLPNVRLLQILI